MVEFNYPPPIILIEHWDLFESKGWIFKGHTLALWNNIKKPSELPIVFHSENSLIQKFPELCETYEQYLQSQESYRDLRLYKFTIDRSNQVTNTTDKLPFLSCASEDFLEY